MSITGQPESVTDACKEILEVMQQEAEATGSRGFVNHIHCLLGLDLLGKTSPAFCRCFERDFYSPGNQRSTGGRIVFT